MDKKFFNRVLVLDDDPASLYLTRLTLEEMNIARGVDTFRTAVNALAFIRDHCPGEHAAKDDCPDLILLDLHMPGMDGFDFLRQLELPGRQHAIRTVVVVLSSSENPRDQDRMQAFGVRGFIVKPLTEEKVMQLVAKQASG